MRALGYRTIGDLARGDERELERVLGSWGLHVARLARGEDDRDVNPHGAARSIGAEVTYEQDLVGADAIRPRLLDHAERIARRLVRAGLSARAVTLKVKYADFTLRTRRATLPAPVNDTGAIHRAAVECLSRMPLEGRRVRLTGISVSGLVEGLPAPSLFPDRSSEKRRAVEELTMRIADKFGDEHTITRATLLKRR
jgi:DNA polymerase-4